MRWMVSSLVLDSDGGIKMEELLLIIPLKHSVSHSLATVMAVCVMVAASLRASGLLLNLLMGFGGVSLVSAVLLSAAMIILLCRPLTPSAV